ncbi:MAG: MerC domain-containing protein [Cellvibrionales bacterium]|nr:MerC domain-containing protein [Cellvibrionales bacterium]
MFALRSVMDKLAISLSLVCALHCLVVPVLVVWMPVLATSLLESELFHLSLVFLVVPFSVIALFLGCEKHKNYAVVILGLAGLLLLLLALMVGHDWLGPFYEKWLTMIGAVLIACSHWKNFKLCQHNDHCDCA